MSDQLIKEFGPTLKIFDSAPIGMAIATLGGVLLRVNDSFCQTIGYDRSELIDRGFHHFTHPEDLSENLKRNRKVISGQMPSHQMEKRYITKEGEVLHAIMKVTTLNDSEGKPNYLLAQVIDITSKVELIEQHSRSEKRFREIFEEAAIAIVDASADSIIRDANEAACNLLEYSRDELIGMHVKEISHPQDLEANKRLTDELVARGGSRYSMEKRYVTKSGKTVHAILKVSMVKGKGEDFRLLGQIVDISSIKDFENQLKQNNKELTKLNKELDAFIYRASHDLRGPLATLKGLVNVHRMQGVEDDITDGMSSSIQKLENVITELVEFSHNSQKAIENREMDIARLIDDSISGFSPHPHFDRIDFRVEVVGGAKLNGDARRIAPIVNNLLTNAISYHDLNKKRPFIKVKCKSSPSGLDLVVEDNGRGMSEDVIDRAFDMFYRGSELSNGSGLGLYLVKEITDKLSGTVTLQSQNGKGTRVDIHIPASN